MTIQIGKHRRSSIILSNEPLPSNGDIRRLSLGVFVFKDGRHVRLDDQGAMNSLLCLGRETGDAASLTLTERRSRASCRQGVKGQETVKHGYGWSAA